MSERASSSSRRPPQVVRPAPAEATLTIGELLARLAPEFPDITHSKVRFLEDRGLVTPQRTASRYRMFSPADVERLRTVLRLQRDQYMPLRVIREHLDAAEGSDVDVAAAGAASESAAAPVPPQGSGQSHPRDAHAVPAGAEPGAGPAARPADPDPSVQREPASRAEVLAAAGGSLALLEALEDHGLLPRETAGRYPRAATDLARAAAVLGEHGIEPRHLRALRSAVGAEAALVEQVVSPLRRTRAADRPDRSPARAEEADRLARELVASLLALHAAALGCALDEVPPTP